MSSSLRDNGLHSSGDSSTIPSRKSACFFLNTHAVYYVDNIIVHFFDTVVMYKYINSIFKNNVTIYLFVKCLDAIQSFV